MAFQVATAGNDGYLDVPGWRVEVIELCPPPTPDERGEYAIGKVYRAEIYDGENDPVSGTVIQHEDEDGESRIYLDDDLNDLSANGSYYHGDSIIPYLRRMSRL